MKKTVCFICAALLLVCLLAGCGGTGSEPAEKTDSTAASETDTTQGDFESQHFVKPAEVCHPDLTQDNPSDAQILFLYEDDGRVSGCTYANEKGVTINTVYNYDDENGTLNLMSFMNAWVVDDVTIKLPGAYSADLGFAEKDGYFIKGYKF